MICVTLPAALAAGERSHARLAHRNLRIERIISAASPEPTEYCQTQDEWVVLLRGEATLEVAGDVVDMRAGDRQFLPSGTPHCVRRTSEGETWLAVHLEANAQTPAPARSLA